MLRNLRKKLKKSSNDSLKRGGRNEFNAETIPDIIKLMRKYPPMLTGEGLTNRKLVILNTNMELQFSR